MLRPREACYRWQPLLLPCSWVRVQHREDATGFPALLFGRCPLPAESNGISCLFLWSRSSAGRKRRHLLPCSMVGSSASRKRRRLLPYFSIGVLCRQGATASLALFYGRGPLPARSDCFSCLALGSGSSADRKHQLLLPYSGVGVLCRQVATASISLLMGRDPLPAESDDYSFLGIGSGSSASRKW